MTERAAQIAHFKTPRQRQIDEWVPMTPATAIVRAVGRRFGLTTDPVDERGIKGPWYGTQALGVAAGLLRGLGMTKKAVANRLGYSPGATIMVNMDYYRRELDEDERELRDELLARARALRGGLWPGES